MAINNQHLFLTFRQRWQMIFLVLILGVSIPVIIWLPERMVQQAYHGDHERSITSANNYAKLVDDYRKTIIQAVGGLLLFGTFYVGLQQLKFTSEQLKIARETQITDRFAKAVGYLGTNDSQGKKQLETRLGSIYVLERIAKDSEYDHWPIMEVLTAYVRQNAAWQESEEGNLKVHKPDKDIQAVLTVVGRRTHTRQIR